MGMTNKDAIKWLASIKKDLGNPRHECLGYYVQAIDEICELLEDREPKRVKNIDDSEVGIRSGFCPKCQKLIYYNILHPAEFCKYCGQAVTWDD